MQVIAVSHIYKDILDIPDTAGHLSAIGANVVHSLDATHMSNTIVLMDSAGFNNFAPVHDSFGCHAEDVCMLEIATKTTFIDMYKKDVLDDLRAQLVLFEDVSDLYKPVKGTLNLDGIYNSTSFFA